MRFRPCIDLHKGKVKQIVGSSLSENNDNSVITNFSTDKTPAYFAELYKKDGLTGGHVIMLGKGNEEAAKQALAAYPDGLQIGGGINPENAEYWLNQHSSKVIVTSYIFPEGKLSYNNLANLSRITGKEKLVIDLSCRKRNNDYVVVLNKWQKFSNTVISKTILDDLAEYCSEFLIHAVDKEGKKQGIEIELLEILAEWSKLPITYAGGINSLKDIEIIKTIGNKKIDFTVGSALDIFGGHIKYKMLAEISHDSKIS